MLRSWIGSGATIMGLGLAGLVLGSAAGATPLGLQEGDVVKEIEIDALKAVPGDGGSYDAGTQVADVDGRVTSVTLDDLTVRPQNDADFTFSGQFSSQLVIDNFTGNPNLIFVQGNFVTPASGPAFAITQTGLGTILTGNFSSFAPLIFQGILNKADFANANADISLTVTANINITGGNAALVNSLGGVGSGAILELSSTVFNFSPRLNVVGADMNFFNDNVTFALSGKLTPTSAAAFVPEPGTALLVGAGLLGLLSAGRRVSRRTRA